MGVRGDTVYGVVPARAALVKDGQSLVEETYWTFVLQPMGSDWRSKAASFSTVRFAPATFSTPTSNELRGQLPRAFRPDRQTGPYPLRPGLEPEFDHEGV